MNAINKRVKVVSVLMFCLSTGAFADDYHYNNILIGDRATGMGGAYTAISDDASGLFYNPAGVVYVTDRNFSASVNAYSAQYKTYENVIGGQPFVRQSSALKANYFGIVKPVGNLKFGFSYAVPDAVNEDLSQNVKNIAVAGGLTQDFTINLNNQDNTINIGPSVAAAINSDLAVGMTLYVHNRSTLIVVNQFVARSDTTNQWTNTYWKLNETGVRPILGVTWSPVEKLSLGASVSTIFLFNSSATFQETCVNTLAPTNCDAAATAAFPFKVPTLSSTDQKRNYPVRLAVGAAYFASSSLLVSTDFVYHTAVQNVAPFENKVATLDAAVGAEYYVNKQWAVRSGLFSNVANTYPIEAGVTNIEEHINIYGLSLSLTRFSGETSVTLGGSVSYGVGQSQITGNTADVQNASTLGWTMFLSSSY
jgi:long-chain fatty acid transport protein